MGRYFREKSAVYRVIYRENTNSQSANFSDSKEAFDFAQTYKGIVQIKNGSDWYVVCNYSN